MRVGRWGTSHAKNTIVALLSTQCGFPSKLGITDPNSCGHTSEDNHAKDRDYIFHTITVMQIQMNGPPGFLTIRLGLEANSVASHTGGGT